MFKYVIIVYLIMVQHFCVTFQDDIFENNDDEDSKEVEETCILPDGTPGKCVDHYLCDDNRRIITDGRGEIHHRTTKPIKLRSWSFTIDESCTYVVSMCCSMKIEEKNNTAKRSEQIIEMKSSQKYGRNCGRRQPNGVNPLIPVTNNNLAMIGEFPWMILIMTYNTTINNTIIYMYECGGSLIHPKVVLTSANCVVGKNMLTARAGEWDTTNDIEGIPHQDRKVIKVIIHENYNAENFQNDIAILLLDSEFEECDNIGVICLASADFRPFEANIHCYTSGWGTDRFESDGLYQAILKKIPLPIVEHNACQEKLRSRLGVDFVLDKSFLCAGGILEKDTCRGDGGSPLVCSNPNNPEIYMQLGIISWGLECGKRIPSVHANVIYLRHWIDKHLLVNNIDMQRYISD